MRKNKILLYILTVASTLTFSSCEKWLDVTPNDVITEETLFESGNGYRTALNGIYVAMAKQNLYGRELTWGAIEAVGQVYKDGAFTSTSTYGMLRDFKFTDKDVESTMESIWTASYAAVANCNNIVAKVANEPASKFAKGEMERSLILGEALALRAFLQFDMLRLFAPAPIADDNNLYIPYYDTHDSNGNPYLTVKQVVEKIVADLSRAKKLVAECDLDEERRGWFAPRARMLSDMTTNIMPDEVFFAYRGYRMNYYAITATLARVYCYNNQMDLAAPLALEVLNATYPDSGNEYKCFELCESYQGNLRGFQEVVFALSNQTINTDYKDMIKSQGNSVDIDVTMYPENEKSDIRNKELITESAGRSYCKKYYEDGNKTDDMIPLIRMSEMIYIVAENYSLKADYDKAIGELKKIRSSKRIFESGNDGIGADSHDAFLAEMFRDMRKDLILEGQYFFQKKRLNQKFNDKTLFVFELPNNEQVN